MARRSTRTPRRPSSRRTERASSSWTPRTSSTATAIRARLPHPLKVIVTGEFQDADGPRPVPDPAPAPVPGALHRATVVTYTSGSTGLPKGVCQPLTAWNDLVPRRRGPTRRREPGDAGRDAAEPRRGPHGRQRAVRRRVAGPARAVRRPSGAHRHQRVRGHPHLSGRAAPVRPAGPPRPAAHRPRPAPRADLQWLTRLHRAARPRPAGLRRAPGAVLRHDGSGPHHRARTGGPLGARAPALAAGRSPGWTSESAPRAATPSRCPTGARAKCWSGHRR